MAALRLRAAGLGEMVWALARRRGHQRLCQARFSRTGLPPPPRPRRPGPSCRWPDGRGFGAPVVFSIFPEVSGSHVAPHSGPRHCWEGRLPPRRAFRAERPPSFLPCNPEGLPPLPRGGLVTPFPAGAPSL